MSDETEVPPFFRLDRDTGLPLVSGGCFDGCDFIDGDTAESCCDGYSDYLVLWLLRSYDCGVPQLSNVCAAHIGHVPRSEVETMSTHPRLAVSR